MTSAQKFLLLSSVVSYLLVLYGFLSARPELLLICFIIHSLLLVLLAYGGYKTPKAISDSENDADLESERHGAEERYNILLSAKQETVAELSKAKAEIEQLKARNTALENEKSGLESEKSLLKTANTELEAEIKQAGDNFDASAVSAENDYSGFLPPLPEGSDGLETINIIQVAKDTAAEFLPFAQKAGVNIQVSSANEKLMVKADIQRIRILFRNIIDNSIKYMNRAGSMVITLSNIGDDIFIVLKDNGNGLSAAETSHIFEINFQGSNRISGNGLGLTQAKAIVESYGGTIYAKSTIGNGMGIYIQIPVQ